MGIHIDIAKEQIAGFCRRNHICGFAFFGSVLRDVFRPDSDIEVLVERRAIEQSPNYIRRRHILNSLETVYVA